jgi:hypothetical protein
MHFIYTLEDIDFLQICPKLEDISRLGTITNIAIWANQIKAFACGTVAMMTRFPLPSTFCPMPLLGDYFHANELYL